MKDISHDDLRAFEIIAQLRRMMVKSPVEFRGLDLNEAVRYTAQLAHSELVSRSISLELRLNPQPLPVHGNAPQLQQIVLNLLLNSAEAMTELAGARRIIVETDQAPSDLVRLAVRDFGPGLRVEEQEKAFQPFHSGKPEGLGLGLSICRQIAEAHGGRLAFDPSVTDGARVVLSLPARSGSGQ